MCDRLPLQEMIAVFDICEHSDRKIIIWMFHENFVGQKLLLQRSCKIGLYELWRKVQLKGI